MAIVREAVAEDYEELVSMAKHFTEISELPLTFNVERARLTLWALIHDPDVDVLVETQEGVVSGGVCVSYEASYYDEICAYVEKFFVHKEFRGIGTSDNLLRALLKTCKKRNAKVIFASATAGMGERVEKLYVRLFERHGFSVLGRIIMRTI